MRTSHIIRYIKFIYRMLLHRTDTWNLNITNMSEKVKNNIEGNNDSEKKGSRKRIKLDTKLEIIKRTENGESVRSVGRSLDLNTSTVFSIVKNKNVIKSMVPSVSNNSSNVWSKRRGIVMEEMEQSLKLWIDDQRKKNLPLSISLIQGKALSLYEDWKLDLGEQARDTPEFRASKGWFDKFRGRAGLHSLKLANEPTLTADKQIVNDFVKTFSKVIAEGNYTSNQIFLIDQTELFWKMLSAYRSLTKETAEFETIDDKIRLLFCGNAAGDFKLKPMVISSLDNFKILKGTTKEMLPVIWKSNPNICLTELLFQNWFEEYFLLAVRQYLSSNNLEFKILLLLNNAINYPQSWEKYPEIKVVLLPETAASDIQSMNKKIITIFKRYYLKRILNQVINDSEKEEFSLKDFWEGYNIWDAINNIGDSWTEIKQSTMNSSWKKLCLDLVKDSNDIEEAFEVATDEVVQLFNEFDLVVNAEDIDELFASDSVIASNEDLVGMQDVNNELSDVKHDYSCSDTKMLTINKMHEALTYLDKFLNLVKEYDSDSERSLQVRTAVNREVACYRRLFEENTSW